jgi:hypothetical protein
VSRIVGLRGSPLRGRRVRWELGGSVWWGDLGEKLLFVVDWSVRRNRDCRAAGGDLIAHCSVAVVVVLGLGRGTRGVHHGHVLIHGEVVWLLVPTHQMRNDDAPSMWWS